MSTPRTTLTKSLHTVTAVSNVAIAVYHMYDAETAVRSALVTLGYPSDWPETDETFAKCVKAVNKARGIKPIKSVADYKQSLAAAELQQ